MLSFMSLWVRVQQLPFLQPQQRGSQGIAMVRSARLSPALFRCLCLPLSVSFFLCAVFCRVYITEHSYVSVKAQVSTSAQEILKIVAEKIQYPEEELALVTVTFSGGK